MVRSWRQKLLVYSFNFSSLREESDLVPRHHWLSLGHVAIPETTTMAGKCSDWPGLSHMSHLCTGVESPTEAQGMRIGEDGRTQ